VAAHPQLEREACRPASIAGLWIVSEWFPVAVTDPPYSVVPGTSMRQLRAGASWRCCRSTLRLNPARVNA